MLYYCFFVLTIFFVTVLGQKNELVDFNLDVIVFSEYIESYDIFNGHKFDKDNEIKEIIVDIVVKRFVGKAATKDRIKMDILTLIEDLQRNKQHRSEYNQVPWMILQNGIYEAVLDCSDADSVDRKSNSPIFRPIPGGKQLELKHIFLKILSSLFGGSDIHA